MALLLQLVLARGGAAGAAVGPRAGIGAGRAGPGSGLELDGLMVGTRRGWGGNRQRQGWGQWYRVTHSRRLECLG